MFKVNEKKAKAPSQANQHAHCIRCKQVSLLCCDKIDQPKMVDRCPHELEDAATVGQKIKKEALRGQMLYPLRKMSDAATWDSAARKLED